MKNKAKIFAVITALILMFSLTACSNAKWSVESVYCESLDLEAESLYRYKIKQIELIADSSVEDNNLKNDKVLKSSTDFKYCYGNSELSSYYYKFTDVGNRYNYEESDFECITSAIFDGLVYEMTNYGEYRAYSHVYGYFVFVRVVFDDLDKVYRPSVSEKGNIATVKYSDIDKSYGLNLGGCCLFKDEISFGKYKKDYEDFKKTVADSALNEDSVKKFKENFNKKYEFTAILNEYKVAFNSSAIPVAIVYSGKGK